MAVRITPKMAASMYCNRRNELMKQHAKEEQKKREEISKKLLGLRSNTKC